MDRSSALAALRERAAHPDDTATVTFALASPNISVSKRPKPKVVKRTKSASSARPWELEVKKLEGKLAALKAAGTPKQWLDLLQHEYGRTRAHAWGLEYILQLHHIATESMDLSLRKDSDFERIWLAHCELQAALGYRITLAVDAGQTGDHTGQDDTNGAKKQLEKGREALQDAGHFFDYLKSNGIAKLNARYYVARAQLELFSSDNTEKAVQLLESGINADAQPDSVIIEALHKLNAGSKTLLAHACAYEEGTVALPPAESPATLKDDSGEDVTADLTTSARPLPITTPKVSSTVNKIMAQNFTPVMRRSNEKQSTVKFATHATVHEIAAAEDSTINSSSSSSSTNLSSQEDLTMDVVSFSTPSSSSSSSSSRSKNSSSNESTVAFDLDDTIQRLPVQQSQPVKQTLTKPPVGLNRRRRMMAVGLTLGKAVRASGGNTAFDEDDTMEDAPTIVSPKRMTMSLPRKTVMSPKQSLMASPRKGIMSPKRHQSPARRGASPARPKSVVAALGRAPVPVASAMLDPTLTMVSARSHPVDSLFMDATEDIVSFNPKSVASKPAPTTTTASSSSAVPPLMRTRSCEDTVDEIISFKTEAARPVPSANISATMLEDTLQATIVAPAQQSTHYEPPAKPVMRTVSAPASAPTPVAAVAPAPAVKHTAPVLQQQQPQSSSQAAAPLANSSLRQIQVGDSVYTCLEELGRGGSSVVYRVLGPDYRVYALKEVKLDARESSSKLKAEIKLLEKLNKCDTVIKLFNSSVTSSAVYMVMECGSLDLATILKHQQDRKKERLDENQIRVYWRQMLEAVQAIHKEAVIHSDLKPANFVLVGESLKLIDFGIAEAIQDDMTSVFRDSQIGTLNYMSPEAFRDINSEGGFGGPNGKQKQVMKLGPASDVWSLGCILFAMAFGYTPFQNLNMIQKFTAICDDNYVIHIPDHPDKALIDTIRRCLERDPKKRISIDELLKHDFLNLSKVVQEKQAEQVSMLISHLIESNFSTASPNSKRVMSATILQQMQNGGGLSLDKLFPAKAAATYAPRPPSPPPTMSEQTKQAAARFIDKENAAVTSMPSAPVKRAPLQARPVAAPQIGDLKVGLQSLKSVASSSSARFMKAEAPKEDPMNLENILRKGLNEKFAKAAPLYENTLTTENTWGISGL